MLPQLTAAEPALLNLKPQVSSSSGLCRVEWRLELWFLKLFILEYKDGKEERKRAQAGKRKQIALGLEDVFPQGVVTF